jgi:hypothetical protein
MNRIAQFAPHGSSMPLTMGELCRLLPYPYFLSCSRILHGTENGPPVKLSHTSALILQTVATGTATVSTSWMLRDCRAGLCTRRCVDWSGIA